ncbi:MAG: carbonic anhydrase [Bacteroidetes bacterium]|nr:carbonic anhydrase [Bacteroidota bacterium]
MQHSYERLLTGNKAWAEDKLKNDPEYFSKLSGIQRPDFLWIGCSDSRVPANEVTGTPPGEIFVHRNVANIVVQTDLNLMSVLQYAVEVLEVKHVIVCGHYGCGGVLAAMGRNNLGIINQWISSIKDVHRLHRAEVDAIPDIEARNDRMVELNVCEQVNNLAKTAIIQSAWKHHKRPDIHGWAYGLKDGHIKTLCTITADTQIDPIFQYDNL